MTTDPNDDEQAALDLVDDLDAERLVIVGLLTRLKTHDGVGFGVRDNAAVLLAAIEKAWPKNATDILRVALYEEIKENEQEAEANFADTDRASGDFVDTAISVIR